MTAATHCVCGGVLVEGGCVSCGAGVSTRLGPAHRGAKKPKPHASHEWGFAGVTFEHGQRERREVCTKVLRKDHRGQPVKCSAVRFIEVGE